MHSMKGMLKLLYGDIHDLAQSKHFITSNKVLFYFMKVSNHLVQLYV